MAKCIHCDNKKAEYFTNDGFRVCENHKDRYDFCSDCGMLFPKGSLNGAKCVECEDRE